MQPFPAWLAQLLLAGSLFMLGLALTVLLYPGTARRSGVLAALAAALTLAALVAISAVVRGVQA